MPYPLGHGLGGVNDLPVPRGSSTTGPRSSSSSRSSPSGCSGSDRCSPRRAAAARCPAGSRRFCGAPRSADRPGDASFALLVLVTSRPRSATPRPTRTSPPLRLRRLLARPARAERHLRERLDGAEPVARRGRRGAPGSPSGRASAGRRRSSTRQRLGRWPGAVLLFAFAALELAYWDPGRPARARRWRSSCTARSPGSACSRTGGTSGPRTARRSPSTSASWRASRPSGSATGRLVVRWPFTGPRPASTSRPGTLAFVAVMLGSVAFDGFSQTELLGRLPGQSCMRPVIQRSPDLADVLGDAAGGRGLALMIALVALAYIARHEDRRPRGATTTAT